jgi:hypothetical protein
MGARWYNPGDGDFTSADTVSVSPDPDSAAGNPFAYAADEPLDLVDPTGHYIVPPGGPDGAGTSERAGNGVTSPNNWIADVATARVVEHAVITAPNNAAKAAAAHAALARVERQQATAHKAAVATAARAAQARAREQAEARARTLALEKLKLIAARQPASKPKDKLPSVDDCPGGPVEGSLLCEETNVQYEGGGSSNAGNTNDWTNERTCVSPGLTVSPCGRFGMASDSEGGGGDASGQGSAGASSASPGASGGDANDLANLANLAKTILEQDDAGSSGARRTLFHYTDPAGQKGILDSQQLNPSLKAANPNDARYGDGQYLSDIEPGTMTNNQLSRAFLGAPFWGSRFTNYIEIEITGLNVVEGRPGVSVIPNQLPLDLSGRIVGWGPN